MAALDRKNLVKDGKYNKAEIMKRAWAYVKNPFCTQYRNNFKAALHAAWVDAKMVMDEMKLEAMNADKPIFPEKGLTVAMLRSMSSSVDMRNRTVCW